MNSCVVYFYKSNKNFLKEDYESAYICSYLRTFGTCDIFLCSSHDFNLSVKYDLYFIKLYEKEQINLLNYFIEKNFIDLSNIFFYGQYSRNNYLLLLKTFVNCRGVIIGDEFDVISSIIQIPSYHEGLAYTNNGKVQINTKISKHISIEDIPSADRSIAIKIKQNFAEVIFSRGCKKQCSFCTIASSKYYDCKSNLQILEELKEVIFTSNIHEIIFKDLSFDDRIYKYGKKSLEELGQMIIENKLDIKFDVNFRVGTFSGNSEEDVSIFQTLRRSGLVRVLLGVESFIESDLVLYNKSYKTTDIFDTIDLCRQNNIYPICSFIFLNPYTSLNQLKMNLYESHRLCLLDFLPASLNILRPESGSPLYNKLVMDKLIISKDEEDEIVWKDKYISVLAKLFKGIYSNKKIWRIYIWISELHQLVNELEFVSKREQAKNIIERASNIFLQINDINYEFLLLIIDYTTNNVDIDVLYQHFNSYLEYISDTYVSEFKMLYINIRREIELSKKIIEYTRR